ncbi:MAG: ABC transporter ATP-binding protein [Rickettsiales bacterium]|nr:ABC transporter ATP-binding protein [Rickettsiales bacterium]
MSACIRLENLTISYQRHPAVHHISGVFTQGSMTAITGPNGAGKSTLLKGLAGIVTPDSGRIILEGLTPSDIAYLPQAVDFNRDFPISVLQMVLTGLWNERGSFKAIGKALRAKALDAIEATGLCGFEHRDISSLSSGQFQRALFARLLLQDAKLILLDEPFAAVDEDTIAKLLEILLRWQREGRTIICVLHDFAHIQRYFPDCVLLARECIAWGKTSDVLRPESIINTRLFQEAWNPRAAICDTP